MIRFRNVVFVRLNFKLYAGHCFVIFQLYVPQACRLWKTDWQETTLYLRVSSCQAMRPLPLKVGPATHWYLDDEPCEVLRLVVVSLW